MSSDVRNDLSCEKQMTLLSYLRCVSLLINMYTNIVGSRSQYDDFTIPTVAWYEWISFWTPCNGSNGGHTCLHMRNQALALGLLFLRLDPQWKTIYNLQMERLGTTVNLPKSGQPYKQVQQHGDDSSRNAPKLQGKHPSKCRKFSPQVMVIHHASKVW